MTGLADVGAQLQREGWQVVSWPEISHLDALYASSFATVGVLEAESAQVVFDNWRDAQGELLKFCEDPRFGGMKDLYLVILIPELADNELPGLSDIVSDTQVCRKTVAELGGRGALEVLAELPYLAVLAQGSSQEIAARILQPADSSGPLTAELLESLATTGATTILSELLDNVTRERKG
jgi:hypothetical protein